jgi:hypothetical protein
MVLKQNFLFILMLLFSSNCLADAEKDIFDVAFYKKYVEEVYITNDFKRGPNLIYDCNIKHFACVNKQSFELCQNRENRAMKAKAENRDCRPIRKYEDQPTCFKFQYKVSQKTRMEKFCKTN